MSDTIVRDDFLPNVPSEGRVGSFVAPWGEGHFTNLYVNGSVIDPANLTLRPLATVPRGEAIGGARAVYLEEVDGEMRAFIARASDPAKWARGFVIEAGGVGDLVNVWEAGPITGLSGIQPGALYYLGEAGEFSPTIPEDAAVYQIIGTGVDAERLSGHIETPTFFQPS